MSLVKASERRDVREPLPFLMAQDHSLPLAVASNNRRLSCYRLVNDSGQIGFMELDFAHFHQRWR
jgi:hypothetical protein